MIISYFNDKDTWQLYTGSYPADNLQCGGKDIRNSSNTMNT